MEGGFGDGFLKVVTAKLRTKNASESPRKSGKGKVRSLPEGRRQGAEGRIHIGSRQHYPFLRCL